jgi:hypothetical protein
MDRPRPLTPIEAESLFSIKPRERRKAQEKPESPQDIMDREFWEELAKVLDELEKVPGNRWKVYRVRGAFRWLFRQLEGPA